MFKDNYLKKDEDKLYLIFLFIFILQFGALVFYNLNRLPYDVSYDSSAYYMQAIEMWNQKTLLPVQWSYQTTLGIDSILPLAALLYGMTGNIFISFGVANIIGGGSIILILNNIMNIVDINKISRYMTINILLIPYSMGMLGYTTMLFTGYTAYCIRVLIPLLLINIIINFQIGKKIIQQKILCTIALILSFGTGFSSGLYVIICGILPIFLYILIDIIKKDDYMVLRREDFIFITTCIVFSSIGLLFQKMTGLMLPASAMKFITIGGFFDNLFACIMGIFELFGALPYDSELIISWKGITFLSKLFILLLVLFSFIFVNKKLTKKTSLQKVSVNLISIIFILNLTILILSNTKYGAQYFEFRYHLLSMIPLLIGFSIFSHEIISEGKKILKTIVIICIITTITIASIDGIQHLYFNNMPQELSQTVSKLKTYKPGTVIVLGSENIVEGRIMRVYDSSTPFIMAQNSNIAIGWGSSTKNWDNNTLKKPVFLLTQKELIETMPKYIKNNCRLIDHYYRYDFYEMKDVLLDYSNLLPVSIGENIVDFPYTYGYIYQNGKINEFGELVTNGVAGCVLFGPYVQVKNGTYDISLNYEVISSNKNVVGAFDVAEESGKEILKTVDLEKNETNAIIKNIEFNSSKNVEFRVFNTEGNIIKVKSVKITKVH